MDIVQEEQKMKEKILTDKKNGMAVMIAIIAGYVLLIAAMIAGVSLLAAWLGQRFGSAGVLITTMLVALAEVHAAAAGVAQLQVSGTVTLDVARWGILGVLSASSLAKTVLAFASGGTRYGFQLAMGLIAMASAAWLGLLLSN